MLEPNDIEDFCDLAKNLMLFGGHGHACCLALQVSLWLQKPPSLAEEKEVASDKEGDEAEIEKEEV